MYVCGAGIYVLYVLHFNVHLVAFIICCDIWTPEYHVINVHTKHWTDMKCIQTLALQQHHSHVIRCTRPQSRTATTLMSSKVTELCPTFFTEHCVWSTSTCWSCSAALLHSCALYCSIVEWKLELGHSSERQTTQMWLNDDLSVS